MQDLDKRVDELEKVNIKHGIDIDATKQGLEKLSLTLDKFNATIEGYRETINNTRDTINATVLELKYLKEEVGRGNTAQEAQSLKLNEKVSGISKRLTELTLKPADNWVWGWRLIIGGLIMAILTAIIGAVLKSIGL